MVTSKPDEWWRGSGVLFLLAYGTYSFGSGTVEAAIMLNILHVVVGLPALVLLPPVLRKRGVQTIRKPPRLIQRLQHSAGIQ